MTRKPPSTRDLVVEKVTRADNRLQFNYNAAKWARAAIDAKESADNVKPHSVLDEVIAEYKVQAFDLAVRSGKAFYAPDGTPVEPNRYIAGPGCITLCWDVPGKNYPHLADVFWEALIPDEPT